MTYCFCILGWYFYPAFYQALMKIPGRKFIISHRPEAWVREQVDFFEQIRTDLYFRENRGLEWGGYHQFIEMGYYAELDFVIFMHDDLVIKRPDFPLVISGRFAADPRLMVIGNGRNGTDWEFRFGKYKERMYYQDEDDFLVRTVRGSFFAARRAVFERIGNFPVRWKVTSPKKGNVSLRNFGYLVSKHFGREAIGYLDENAWLESAYIAEMVRGVL